MEKSILDKLDAHNWEASVTKLNVYALRLCKYRGWDLPVSLDPEDIVIEAVKKVYAGERRWNPEKDPDLFAYMKSVVKSMIGKLAEPRGRRTNLDALKNERSPADEDEALDYDILHAAISQETRGDPELAIVYKGLKDGLKPRDIAREYAIPMDTVRNSIKRLRRLVENIIERLNRENQNELQ